MIEVNLSNTRSTGDVFNVGGFDLSHLNVKMIIVGLLVLYIPENFLLSYYEGSIEDLKKEETIIRTDVRKISSKVRGLNNIKKQVDALNDQEKKLAEKLQAVKVIINKRQNPFKILYYIAQSTPEKVWLTSMKMEGKQLILQGHAENWKDIGNFLEALKNSIFLSNLQYKVPEGAQTDYNGRKVEVFQITSDITRFK